MAMPAPTKGQGETGPETARSARSPRSAKSAGPVGCNWNSWGSGRSDNWNSKCHGSETLGVSCKAIQQCQKIFKNSKVCLKMRGIKWQFETDNDDQPLNLRFGKRLFFQQFQTSNSQDML
jgi:hypothetical protein